MTNRIHIEDNEGPKAVQKSARPKRIPVGSRDRLKWDVPGNDKEFHYRVVNDVENRVQIFKDAGYEIVTGDCDLTVPEAGDPSQISSVARKYVGGGTHGILMRIPKEWFDEDQEAKMSKVKKMEESMEPKARAELGGQPYGEGIKIERG